jgi:phenylalanyl-tRNA synthetase beta chain
VTIPVHTDRLNRWLGTQVSAIQARTLLAQQGCRVAASSLGGVLQVNPPSYRRDLAAEVDLYEEVARAVGYDRIPATRPTGPLAGPAAAAGSYERTQALRCLCAGLGLTEAISWSLVSAADLSRAGHPPEQAVRLANPLSQDHAYLRPDLVAGLLHSVRRNLTTGSDALRLFELGQVFPRHGSEAARESLHLGIAVSGAWLKDWTGERPADWFQLKGVVEALLRRLGQRSPQWVPMARPWMAPGQGAGVRVDGQAVGVLGQVSHDVARALDLAQPVWLAELEAAALLDAPADRPTAVEPPPAFPPVKRDLSFVITHGVPYDAIEDAIREAGAPQLAHAALIDRYHGEKLPPGTHSLTFSLEYRQPDRTLTSAEVDQVHQRIVAALAQHFGAKLR